MVSLVSWRDMRTGFLMVFFMAGTLSRGDAVATSEPYLESGSRI